MASASASAAVTRFSLSASAAAAAAFNSSFSLCSGDIKTGLKRCSHIVYCDELIHIHPKISFSLCSGDMKTD
jgi:hypothetical protein